MANVDPYLEDSYLKEYKSVVENVVEGKYVTLDKTIFYPDSGGQPYDTGKMTRLGDGKEFSVVYAKKFGGKVSHEVSEQGLQVGDKVLCKLDWGRRYKLMRCHTAEHLFSHVVETRTGSLVTGNQLDLDKCRTDFPLEEFNEEIARGFVEETNRLIEKNLPVKLNFMTKEEAMKKPELFKLAKGMNLDYDLIRIVNIGDINIQADGGTHVKSTKEIGRIEFAGTKNKGAKNRRIYTTIVP